MFKRFYCLLFVLCVCSSSLFSQHFMQSAGATISAITGTVKIPGGSESFGLSQTNLTYFPRFNFVENEHSSISVGAPIGLGIAIVTNTIGNDVGISFAYDLPLVVDYNIGCKSTKDNDRSFGGYVGAGFGYYKINISNSEYSNYNGATYGPMVRGGVRFKLPNWDSYALTIGMYYKKGMEADKLTTIGFNVLYDF